MTQACMMLPHQITQRQRRSDCISLTNRNTVMHSLHHTDAAIPLAGANALMLGLRRTLRGVIRTLSPKPCSRLIHADRRGSRSHHGCQAVHTSCSVHWSAVAGSHRPAVKVKWASTCFAAVGEHGSSGFFAYFYSIPGYLTQRNVQIGIASIAIATYAFLYPPVGWETSRDGLADHGSFALYWITLGVLSSVGLGMRVFWIQTV